MPRAALAVLALMSGLIFGATTDGGGCTGAIREAAAPQVGPLGEQDVLAWTRLSSVTTLFAGMGDSLAPRPALERSAIAALGLPAEAASATDWQRPLVVALLDPQTSSGCSASTWCWRRRWWAIAPCSRWAATRRRAWGR